MCLAWGFSPRLGIGKLDVKINDPITSVRVSVILVRLWLSISFFFSRFFWCIILGNTTTIVGEISIEIFCVSSLFFGWSLEVLVVVFALS